MCSGEYTNEFGYYTNFCLIAMDCQQDPLKSATFVVKHSSSSLWLFIPQTNKVGEGIPDSHCLCVLASVDSISGAWLQFAVGFWFQISYAHS